MKNEADFTDYSDYVKKTSPGLLAWLGGDTNGTLFGVDRAARPTRFSEENKVKPEKPWHEGHYLNYKYKMLVDLACQLIIDGEVSIGGLIDMLEDEVSSRQAIQKSLHVRPLTNQQPATVQSSMKILKEMYPDTGFLRQPNADAYEVRTAYTYQPPAELPNINCIGKLSDQKDGPFRHAVIYEDSNAPKNTIYTVKLSDWGYDSMEIDGKDGPTKVVSSKPEPQPNRSCAVCTKCNQMNEYAEPTPNYVCYACR